MMKDAAWRSRVARLGRQRAAPARALSLARAFAPAPAPALALALLLALAPRAAGAITWLGAVTARPSAPQLAWQAREIGVMIGWNLQTACLPESFGNASAQACQASGFVPNLDAVEGWAPAADTERWLDVAASFGARYAVLVADHFSGFLLWHSKVSNFSMMATQTKVDVVAAFAASCAARGIAPGYFYSVHSNWLFGLDSFRMGHPRLYGGAPLSAAEYEALAMAQLRELLAYEGVSEVWFDAGVNATLTPNVGPLVAQLARDVVCHSCAGFDQRGGVNESGAGVGVRWMGNEDAIMPLPNWGATTASYTADGGDPQGAIFAPASCDTVLSQHFWFDSRLNSYEENIKGGCELVNAYLTSVGRGCNLILNLAPDWLGAISDKAAAAYAGLGASIACLAAAPLARAANVTLYDAAGAPPLDSGVAVWTLPSPVAGRPCGTASSLSASSATTCFSLSLRLAEAMAESGQRIGAWAVAGCFAAAPLCTADSDWLPLTSELPASAATSIGARRFVRLEAELPSASANLSALRFTVGSAYEWAGGGGGSGGAAPPGQQPLVLASAALYDWADASGCVPANCSLVSY